MDNGLKLALLKLVTKVVDLKVEVLDSSTVEILTKLEEIIDTNNNVKSKLYIDKNGVSVPVTLDTSSPYATIPIPVTITGIDGSSIVNINAGDLEVNIQHDGLNPSSVQIGDGTDTMTVNVDGSINTNTTVQNEFHYTESNFKFHDEAVNSVLININYFGFASFTGDWYIAKEDNIAKTMRYIYGNNSVLNYITAWANRESLIYDYLFNL
jgi:hypothetical protein